MLGYIAAMTVLLRMVGSLFKVIYIQIHCGNAAGSILMFTTHWGLAMH